MQEPERQLALVLVWSQARLSEQVMPKQPPMPSSVAIPGSTIAACIGIMPWVALLQAAMGRRPIRLPPAIKRLRLPRQENTVLRPLMGADRGC